MAGKIFSGLDNSAMFWFITSPLILVVSWGAIYVAAGHGLEHTLSAALKTAGVVLSATLTWLLLRATLLRG